MPRLTQAIAALQAYVQELTRLLIRGGADASSPFHAPLVELCNSVVRKFS